MCLVEGVLVVVTVPASHVCCWLYPRDCFSPLQKEYHRFVVSQSSESFMSGRVITK
jgi:hypothetical protein